jgi:4-carboxymuconolactone decarboxylase
MPRLPEVTSREALPQDKREVYDYLAETRGSVRLPFSVVLNNPEVARRFAQAGSYFRFEAGLPREVCEAAICATAREMDCAFEWAAHARMAPAAGIDGHVLDAIAQRRELEGIEGGVPLAVRFARQLLRGHRVDDATFAEARSRFGDSGILDLTGTIGYYAGLACLINAMDIQPAPDAPRLP